MNRWLRFAAISAAVAIPAALLGPYFIPVRPLKGTVPPEQLADPDSHFASLNGLRVHYKTAGQGQPAMLLLHGLAASFFSWREVIRPLAEYGTVVAFDRPAFGLTSRPLAGRWLGRNPYSPEAQADFTVALLDHLAIEQAVLVGSSLGGMVATLTALRYPSRVQALVLVDPAVYFNGLPIWLRPILRSPQMRHLGPLLARLLAAQRDAFIGLAWHDPSRVSPDIVAGYLKPTLVHHWDRAFWEFAMAHRPLNLAAHLHQIHQPVLVITGDDDRVIPTRHSIRLAQAIPQAELTIIANCGHLPHEERPADFLNATLPFLAKLRPTAFPSPSEGEGSGQTVLPPQ
jgi:pimeloyl-ACP methyl ester carboxylesterase